MNSFEVQRPLIFIKTPEKQPFEIGTASLVSVVLFFFKNGTFAICLKRNS